jgi:hypothetical protein
MALLTTRERERIDRAVELWLSLLYEACDDADL